MILTTKNLRKTFGTKKEIIESVKDVSITINAGEIFGFIGPNGAGKTTTMRMLSTLLLPTSGSATIAGFDLIQDAQNVRRSIGYVSQTGGLDQHFTARENLIFQGRLYDLSKHEAAQRAQELIKALQIEPFADRLVTTYSGGQRRRVDIAMALMHKPKLLFLDEPTAGLDPQSRAHLWNEICTIREEGTTVFLTTHYLEEVDALCDRVAIIDYGLIVAEGTTEELKRTISGDIIIVGATKTNIEQIQNVMKSESYIKEIKEIKEGVRIAVEHGETALPHIIRTLDQAQVTIQNIALSKPSLDDVFLKQTGRTLREHNQ